MCETLATGYGILDNGGGASEAVAPPLICADSGCESEEFKLHFCRRGANRSTASIFSTVDGFLLQSPSSGLLMKPSTFPPDEVLCCVSSMLDPHCVLVPE